MMPALRRIRSMSRNLDALHLRAKDLDLLTIGMVLDIWTEKGNDGVKYDRVASQEDFDKF